VSIERVAQVFLLPGTDLCDISARACAGSTVRRIQKVASASCPAPRPRAATNVLYNSIDDRHDGLITVYFGRGVDPAHDPVVGVEYSGDWRSIPTGVPRITDASRRSILATYGEPTATESLEYGAERLYFRNGLYAIIGDGHVTVFGVIDRRGAHPSTTARMTASVVSR
jgi:hypothetical protein